jgi:DNA methyltransferase 1-associated protein 1
VSARIIRPVPGLLKFSDIIYPYLEKYNREVFALLGDAP